MSWHRSPPKKFCRMALIQIVRDLPQGCKCIPLRLGVLFVSVFVADSEPGGRGLAAARLLASTRGDSELVCGACDFDVVVWGCQIEARALQPHVVAYSAEGLLVEDQFGGPALEVDAG